MKTALVLLFCCAASAPGQSSIGAFTATGAMAIARSWHTATLLNNGQVLSQGAGSVATLVYPMLVGW